jgi:hypothetical protein
MIANGFKIKSSADSVFKCSSRVGLSALTVLRLSEAGMPDFQTIWENPIAHEARQLFFA